MQLGPLLRVTFAVALVPVLAVWAMVLAGAATPQAALLGTLAIVLAAVGLALALAHDVGAILISLRAAAEDPTAAHAPLRAPLLAPSEEIPQELRRLSRQLAERAALVARLRQADDAIVQALPDPLIVLGADRGIRRANQAARTAFGADLASVLRHPALRAAIDRALAQGVPQTADLVLPVPVARELQATVIGLEQRLADGGTLVIVLSDRTRERAIERMRADFVANASHELRTPLASLIGFIDTLRGPAADDPPAQQRFLGIMAEQAARMSRLIDDLLSLSRIELTEHQPPPDEVDVGSLIARIAAGMEPALAGRRQHLELELAPHLPPVAGDADQLAQVAQNLLDNAVKYGRESGTVRVRAAIASGTGWPARPGLVLAVQDDGAGIPRAHIPRLTERFYRVDKGRSRAVGGTGLGLAIVKHIVNRHRGLLTIESVEGQGSTFSVWLPLAASAATPARAPGLPSPP
jgi:two-component system, OmpR family, phosphate regulon sensor histidine kinase PhoR